MTKESKFHSKSTRTMTPAAIVLLVHRPLRDAMTFCIFEKIYEPRTAKKKNQE
jgi:hypothetical protein